jgi:Tfp pilus assembly protein PilN
MIFILAWDRCYDFLNSFAKNLAKMAFLTQNKAKLFENLSITLVFVKNAIFSPKVVKNRRKV